MNAPISLLWHIVRVLDRLEALEQGAAVQRIDTRSGDNACTIGFGHFQEIPRDMPLLKKLGVALVQQELFWCLERTI